MNSIYVIARDARDRRGFTHLLAADGTLTPLSLLADKKAKHSTPNGWAYVDRKGIATVTHYDRSYNATGWYELIKQDCKHPPARLYSWHAHNPETGKADILCVCCCECGEILTGGAE